MYFKEKCCGSSYKDEKNNITIFKAGNDIQGFYYKDTDAWENNTDEIVYIPEYSFDNNENDLEAEHDMLRCNEDNTMFIWNGVKNDKIYTKKDFLELAKQTLIDFGIKPTKKRIDFIANDLFEIVDWQSPESVAYAWDDLDLDF